MQLNDTHPAIAVAELMRLLVDEVGMEWGEAWDITRRTLGYTNHTLMPEALERWPLAMFRRLLPRHLEIIYEINARFLDEVRIRFWDDEARVARLSLIDEHGERYVRMANLACVGSHAINGVAELHSELLTRDVLEDFHAMWPERFGNKTNGVTPRRWIALANPRLARLISDAIGEGWLTQLDQLAGLEAPVLGRRLPRRLAGGQARQQGRIRRLRAPPSGRRRSTRSRCSTCRSSASTSTSAST